MYQHINIYTCVILSLHDIRVTPWVLGRSPPPCPLLWFTCLVGPPHVRGHIKARVLSHTDQA